MPKGKINESIRRSLFQKDREVSNPLTRACVQTPPTSKLPTQPCDEVLCSTLLVGDDFSGFRSAASGIPKSGLGLYASQNVAAKTVVGRFGGQLQCGKCVRKFRKLHPHGEYDVMRGDLDYNEGKGQDVFWHLTRTYDTAVDGSVWFINSSGSFNRKPYKTPNVVFVWSGFYRDGTPCIEVESIKSIDKGSELLAHYYKSRKRK